MNVKHKVQRTAPKVSGASPENNLSTRLHTLEDLEQKLSEKAEEFGLLMDQYVNEAKALHDSVDTAYGKEGNGTRLLNRILTLDIRIAERIFASRTLSHRAKVCACLNQLYGFTHWVGDL